MPDLTLLHVALLTGMLLAGVIAGWTLRSGRSVREKKSINAGWQAQIDSQQSEHERLASQNQSLMEQVSQYQASNRDTKQRAKELSDSLKEAFEHRDTLQSQIKEIRGKLEVSIAQRDKLKASVDTAASRAAHAEALKSRDLRIAKLSKELANWQSRVPPLVERYRQRDLEAQQLDLELQKANERIAELESESLAEHTRIEPLSARNLPNGLDASNEAHTETSVLDDRILDDDFEQANDSVFTDQIDEDDAKVSALPLSDDDSSDVPLVPAAEFAVWLEDEADEVEDEDEADADEEEDEADADDDDGLDRPPPAASAADIAPTGADDQNANAEEPGDPADAFPNLLDDNYVSAIAAPDDLQKIKGVGPAIEKTLNDLGIYRYWQIADMSEYDIDRVAKELKGFRSRIYREDWIGQARLLLQETAGE